MLNIFKAAINKSPDQELAPPRPRPMTFGTTSSIENMQKDLDLYIQKSQILAETLAELDNNPRHVSQTIENQKITTLIISVLNKILVLKKEIEKQDHKTPELSELFNEYCDKLVDLYFNDKEASIMALNCGSEFAAMQPNDENYQALKLALKAKQHYIIGKEYAMKLLRTKIEFALANPAKSSFRKLYDNFLAGSEITPYSSALFLQLSLVHLVLHTMLAKIPKQKQHLIDLKQRIFAEREKTTKYDLIEAYNLTLSSLVLTDLNASLCSTLIKIKAENIDETQHQNYQKLLKVFHDYLRFHTETFNSPTCVTTFKIPAGLMGAINIALADNSEELECRQDLVESTSIKFLSPPIPPRRPSLKKS